jgi:chromosomal replication initiator protein
MTGFLSIPKPRAKVAPIQGRLTEIRDFVAEYYGLSGRTVASKSRKREIAWARHVGIYISCAQTKEKLVDIGKCYNRKHSTALHSYYVVSDAMEQDAGVRKEVNELIGGIDNASV